MGELPNAFRLPHLVAPGAWQMSSDSALLEWVSRGSARLAFRTYSWDRPTLSLGRSEPYPDGWDEAALAREGIAIVRRPTGGSGVLHWEELTFAAAASIPGPWGVGPRGFANRVADALAEALSLSGVPASRAESIEPGSASGSAPGRRRAVPCFARIEPGEVRAKGYKVAGLASRFSRTGALCHASVPLTARHRDVARFRLGRSERADLDRHARSAGELLGRAPDPSALAGRLERAIEARFGVVLEEGDFRLVGIAEPALVAAAS
ncbi:MAG: lipoate--protein ligase family protein [Candidatus Latescibacteria bacterium]|nr:lipoate--protein ligase family protein [Candidatus Latescibacterota bacterium]